MEDWLSLCSQAYAERTGYCWTVNLERSMIMRLTCCCTEREVKKANRELNNLTSRMDDMQKIEVLQKRVTEHLADMKRLERENIKNKKRGDMLQKEKDLARTEQSKTNTLKDKLEKLCRELQRENNRLKVYMLSSKHYLAPAANCQSTRTRTRCFRTPRRKTTPSGTTSSKDYSTSYKMLRTRRIIHKLKS